MISKNSVKIILASSSPRRIEMMEQLNLDFQAIKPEIEEIKLDHETPEEYAKRNSHEKAHWVMNSLKNINEIQIILGADTFVVLNEKVLEKPKDRLDAINMLRMLSGKTHRVLTAFTLLNRDKKNTKTFSHLEESKVTFKALSNGEIDYYVNTKEPFDKAGSYAIQGKGSFMIEKIEGSFSNVIGLPINKVVDVLTKELKLDLWS